MLWARRAESRMVYALTLYPSSASVAAADAPARPVPTTMTVYLRLLAGLTSFASPLYRSHFSVIGPDGIFESSFILMEPLRGEVDVERQGIEADRYQQSQDGSQAVDKRRPPRLH